MHNPLHDSSAPTSTLSSLLPQSSQRFAVVHCSKFALDVALDSVAPHVDLATSSRVLLLLRPINGFRTSRLPLLLHSTSPRACAHVDDLSPSSFFVFVLLLAFCPIQRRGSTPIPSQQASSSSRRWWWSAIYVAAAEPTTTTPSRLLPPVSSLCVTADDQDDIVGWTSPPVLALV